MANPVLTQAEFDSVFNRFLEALGWWATLREMRRRFAESKVRTSEIGNENAFTSNWVFTNFNVASMTGDRLFIRIADETPGAGQAEVSLYSDAGAVGLVAQGDAADSTTLTLAEQNNSGISGTVDIGVVNASETDDFHALIMQPDFPQRLSSIFDGTEDRDLGQSGTKESHATALQSITSNIQTAMDTAITEAENLMTAYISERIKATSTTAGVVKAVETDDAGVVTETITGILEEFRLAMLQNTTVQTIGEKVMTAGAVTFQATNRGLGSFGAITLRPYARVGRVSGVVDDDTLGTESFGVTLNPDDLGGVNQDIALVNGDTSLTVDAQYRAPAIGIESMTMVRTWTKTGDGGDVELGPASAFTAVGEDDINTTAGKLYFVSTGASPNITVSVFSDSSATAKVAEATGVTASAAFTATPVNNSGLTIVGDAGSAPTGTTIEMNLNVFKGDSEGNNAPDRFDFDITAAAAQGFIQEIVGEMFGWELNETAGAPTQPDGKLQRGTVNPLLVIAE